LHHPKHCQPGHADNLEDHDRRCDDVSGKHWVLQTDLVQIALPNQRYSDEKG
jgi:hypothetical protein